MAIRHYFWIIKTRWKTSPLLFVHWVLLRTKKFLKIDFVTDCLGTEPPLDIVIPTVSKDYSLLSEVLASVRNNICHPVNNIYIVSRREPDIIDFCSKNDCTFVDETSLLGYGKDAIHYVVQGVDRSGWIFQQLLKLSAGKYTELDNYFVLDSDTVLVSKHTFMERDQFVFLQSEEWHQPYFKAFKKMFGYGVKTKLSYTSHMMIFNRDKLTEMKEEMEQKGGAPWDQIYLSTINEKEASCVSDYDTYANWMLCNYPNLLTNRPLYNKPLPRSKFEPLDKLEEKYGSRLKSVSFHSYLNSNS